MASLVSIDAPTAADASDVHADAASLPTAADTQSAWRYDEWLAAYALDERSVLDYFAHSPYYDLDCLNEQAKAHGLTPDEVRQLTGTEFGVAAAAPDLFVIERRLRRGPDDVGIVAVFYVLQGTLYVAPDLHTLLSSRVERAAWRLEQAVLAARTLYAERLAAAAAERGAGDGGGGGGGDAPATGDEARAAAAARRLIDDLLGAA